MKAKMRLMKNVEVVRSLSDLERYFSDIKYTSKLVTESKCKIFGKKKEQPTDIWLKNKLFHKDNEAEEILLHNTCI